MVALHHRDEVTTLEASLRHALEARLRHALEAGISPADTWPEACKSVTLHVQTAKTQTFHECC